MSNLIRCKKWSGQIDPLPAMDHFSLIRSGAMNDEGLKKKYEKFERAVLQRCLQQRSFQ